MRAGPRTKKIIPISSPRYHRKHRPFIDKVRVLLSSGRGGDGASIMDAQKNMEFGGPIGGNGGQGGSVFVRTSHLYPDLFHIKSMGTSVTAGAGGKGKDMLCYGNNGRHLVLDVPLGTVIRDADSNQEIADLSSKLNEMIMVLEGGIGGKGNAAFKSSVCVSPVSATNGLPGNSVFASIELKTLADVSLVGLPNAGKSSILGAISTCRPEVAAYPFTTLNPFVGKLYSFVGDQTCDIADLPGLVEGAYENRGLGHQFLQHVERSKLICLVVDMNESYCSYDYELEKKELMRSMQWREEMKQNGFDDQLAFDKKDPFLLAAQGKNNNNNDTTNILTSTTSLTPSPVEVVDQLIQELYFYDPSLPPRIACVLCNKMDKKVDENGVPLSQKFMEVKNHVRRKLGKHVECFPVSANIALHAGNPEALMQQEAEETFHHNNNSNNNKNSLQQQQQGLDHPSLSYDDEMRRSGLPAAIEFLTKRVFDLKRKEKEERERRDMIRNQADEELHAEKYRLLNRDPADFADRDNENNDDDEFSSMSQEEVMSMSPAELKAREDEAKQKKQKEALDRLLQMKGKRRNRGVSSSSNNYVAMMNSEQKNPHQSDQHHQQKQTKNSKHFKGDSHQPTTNFTSAKRDFFGKKSSSDRHNQNNNKDFYYSASSASRTSTDKILKTAASMKNIQHNSSLFDDQFGDYGFADSLGPMKSSYGREFASRMNEMVTVEDDIVGKYRINTEQKLSAKQKNKFGTHSKIPETATRVAQRATYGRGFGDEEEQ